MQPYPELREVLNVFIAEVQAELANNLVGAYLVGSLASGDFDLDNNIDFLVVINTELNATNVKSCQGTTTLLPNSTSDSSIMMMVAVERVIVL